MKPTRAGASDAEVKNCDVVDTIDIDDFLEKFAGFHMLQRSLGSLEYCGPPAYHDTGKCEKIVCTLKTAYLKSAYKSDALG